MKTPVPNLVRDTPSGKYFVRLRIDGKLFRESLKTDVFSVAKLRLADPGHCRPLGRASPDDGEYGDSPRVSISVFNRNHLDGTLSASRWGALPTLSGGADAVGGDFTQPPLPLITSTQAYGQGPSLMPLVAGAPLLLAIQSCF